MLGKFRLVRSEYGFIFCIFLSTLLMVLFNEPSYESLDWPAQVGWALTASLFGYLILDSMKYLDSFHTRPSKADLLTLYLTLLLPYAFLKQLFFAFSGHVILQMRHIALWLPLVAFSGWIFRYLSGIAFERSGNKRIVWLLLDGGETVEVQREFRENGISPFYNMNGNADNADLVITSKAGSGCFENSPDLLLAYLNGIPVRDFQHILAEIRGRENLDTLDLWTFLLTAIPQRRAFRFFIRLKSIFEPIFAAFFLVLLAPLCVLVAFIIRIESPGPVLYRQRRVGYKGKEFELIKFRSMVVNAEKDGPAWAGQQSSKMTRLGAFLRKSHLDEIPQLWNVLRKEMSFVGPRPERPEYYAILKPEIPLFWIRTLVRPGITGWAQVRAGYASSAEESKTKLEFDLYYMRRMTPVFDLKILIRTLMIVLFSGDKKAL